MTAAMMQHEIEQVNATGLFCYRYGFFSRSGFAELDKTRKDIVTYQMEDLFA